MDDDTSVSSDVELDLWPPSGFRTNPDRIRAITTDLGLNPTSTAKALSVSRKTTNTWLVGAQPDNNLDKLSELLDVSPASLGYPLAAPPTVGPFFRRLPRLSYRRISERATAHAQLVADIANYLEKRVGLGLAELPSAKEPMRRDPAAVARAARVRLNVGSGPIANVIRTAEQAGAIFSYATQQTSSIEGYSVEIGRWPIALLKPEVNYYRQRWSAAHELGHLLMHRSAVAIDEGMEAEANQFAAEFLLPARLMHALLPEAATTSLDEYKPLKEEWGVSIATLMARGYELGVMPRVEYTRAKELHASKGWTRLEPGQMQSLEVTSTLPEALKKYLDFGFDRDLVIREIGIPRTLFEGIVSRAPLDLPSPPRFEP